MRPFTFNFIILIVFFVIYRYSCCAYDVRLFVPAKRFTEPVEMKDGRIITRVAEYFILNARALLDTYRNDQQLPEVIPIEDCRKILRGILYALAEGQHLDFSNTELEMPKGSWDLFERFAAHSNYEYIAKAAMSYLYSIEIYGLVHRASPRQYVQDGQIEGVTGGIAELSVN